MNTRIFPVLQDAEMAAILPYGAAISWQKSKYAKLALFLGKITSAES